MICNEDSQYITVGELDQMFKTGRACVGISMKGYVTQLRGEVF